VGQNTEGDNFYYRLTDHNLADLAHSIAIITGTSVAYVHELLAEVEQDDDLHAHIRSALSSAEATRDSQAALGRRVGWYAFVRLLRPRLVVETGVHHGVGGCVIAQALLRNAAEGHPGRYLGTDIDPTAGRLLTGRYVGEVRIGDSLTTLRTLDEPVDIFINDSDHSADYESSEYVAIAPLLSDASLVIGDNSHAGPLVPRGRDRHVPRSRAPACPRSARRLTAAGQAVTCSRTAAATARAKSDHVGTSPGASSPRRSSSADASP
jgi:hypothetical protein